MLENLKNALATTGKDAVKEAAKETITESAKTKLPTIGLVALGVGLAIFGLGLICRRPSVVVVR